MFREVCVHVELGGGIREAMRAPNKLYPFSFYSSVFHKFIPIPPSAPANCGLVFTLSFKPA